jgi:MFS family permease
MIHRIWHLLFFVFTLGVIDATFWTVGTLLSEEVGNGGDHGLLLVMYGLPVLFIGIFAGWASRPFGKKRAAFLCGIGSGTMLTLAGLTRDHNLLLVFVFLSSMFLAISWPEIYAVFEDYVCRLGKTSNDMIGLQSSTMAMAYLIGPILAGGIASVVGRQQTFTVVGILLVIISVLALIIVPRKIRLPQAELTKLIV